MSFVNERKIFSIALIIVDALSNDFPFCEDSLGRRQW